MNDKEAERLVNTYSDMISKICYTYLKSMTEVEDICQNVFLKLICHQLKFHSLEHEKAWVIRTTINMCKDYLKSAWIKRVIPLEEKAILYPIWNNNSEEIERLGELGIGTDVSETCNGITFKVDGLVGDEHIVLVTHTLTLDNHIKEKISNKIDSLGFRYVEGNILKKNISGCTMYFHDLSKGDNNIYLSAIWTSDDEIYGEEMNIQLKDLSYCDENGEIHTLVEGEWKFSIPLYYENTSVKVMENETFEWNGYDIHVKEISVSKLGIYISFMCKEDLTILDLRFLPFVITMKDGNVFDFTGISEKGIGKKGLLSNIHEGYLLASFGSLQDIENIKSITIGSKEILY